MFEDKITSMNNIKIIIDSDILIQLKQQLAAEKRGYQLDCFFTVADFLASAQDYSRETPIYFSSEFEKQILHLEFKHIYPLQELNE